MEKINKLKKIFKKNNINGYIIPKNDEFFGEYIPDRKDRLKFISNFSGSYGFALILNNKNYLFVDGRYTLQAKNQCNKFFNIKTIPGQMPKDVLKIKSLKIGFDPKLFTKKSLNMLFYKTNCKLVPLKINLIDEIWMRKNNISKNKFYILPQSSTSQTYKRKVNKIISIMKKKGADFQFISASENNAWLLNIRGGDTEYTPIPQSYILIDQKKNIKFFCDLKKTTSSFKKKFSNIEFVDINLTDSILSNINRKKFIIDKSSCSIYFENIILNGNIILDQLDPIYILKAVKEKKEIENVKKSSHT
ncbi:aminopeptidase P family N-terminal domain-containing protein [Pelagibacteraceae bacterium]|nr:aminopeptidase P family N-terminal domain-containing protein [Pelagibacteraceae bacterium]